MHDHKREKCCGFNLKHILLQLKVSDLVNEKTQSLVFQVLYWSCIVSKDKGDNWNCVTDISKKLKTWTTN